MKFKIDNEYIDRERIVLPAMNYGQKWRYEKFRKVNYEIQVSPEDFFEKTSDWFKEFRLDAVEDLGIANKGEFLIYDKYESAGFPGLNKLINENQLLLSEIILFHDLDVLNVLCNHKTSEKGCLYLINSLEKVLINEYLTLQGIAFMILKDADK